MNWCRDKELYESATRKPYCPPHLDGPNDEKVFDDEFIARVRAFKRLLRSCGYVEMYDDDNAQKPVHYHCVSEHSGDRTIAFEMLHSAMGRDCHQWIPKVQAFLSSGPQPYQILVTTLFEDPEGDRLLPGFACLVIRHDVLIARFSTPAVAALFNAED